MATADPFAIKRSNSNKITDIVRLQQMIKKWKKLAVAPKPTTATAGAGAADVHQATCKKSTGSMQGFLKRTLSFSDTSPPTEPEASSVPKGFVAITAGEERRRFVVPMEYLSSEGFVELLREAEEEFGFENAGVLHLPCDVEVLEEVIRVASEDEKRRKRKEKKIAVSKRKKKEGFGYCSLETGDLDVASSRQFQHPKAYV